MPHHSQILPEEAGAVRPDRSLTFVVTHGLVVDGEFVGTDDELEKPPLTTHAALNHLKALRVAIAQHHDAINQRDPDGDRVPLHWAAARGFTGCAVALVNAGADPELTERSSGLSASELAEARGHVETAFCIRTAERAGRDKTPPPPPVLSQRAQSVVLRSRSTLAKMRTAGVHLSSGHLSLASISPGMARVASPRPSPKPSPLSGRDEPTGHNGASPPQLRVRSRSNELVCTPPELLQDRQDVAPADIIEQMDGKALERKGMDEYVHLHRNKRDAERFEEPAYIKVCP